MPRRIIPLLAALLSRAALPVGAETIPADSGRQSLDAGWRFHLGETAQAAGAEFDDSAWRPVHVPHDWSIEGPFDPSLRIGGLKAFLPSGIGWYRKSFLAPPSLAGKRVVVEFDGVMANSEVWINGHRLGRRPNGYVGFSYELTEWLHTDGARANVLAVRVDTAAQPASRWYTGSGIYRHVKLRVSEPLSLEPDQLFLTTPAAGEIDATVSLRAVATNRRSAPGRASLHVTIHPPGGGAPITATVEPMVITAGDSATFETSVHVPRPLRWAPDTPSLYRATIELRSDGRRLDRAVITFGIREIRFEAATGFWINGKNLKLKGVGIHHDAGAFGAAVPLSIWKRRLENLKLIGVNAIRTAHSPAAPEFLDLCDRLGFFVVDEFFDCWAVAKLPNDYHLQFEEWGERDAGDIVRRDRNHPSVIMYSLGNEVRDTREPEPAKKRLNRLMEAVRRNDPSRPCTLALFRPTTNGDFGDGFADLLDVIGQNYREGELLAAHEAKPSRRIIVMESTNARESWLTVRDSAPFAGQFIWAGIDYLGESRRWPVIGWGPCLLDRTGLIRPRGRERQSWWSDEPMVFAARRVMFDLPRPSGSPYDAEIPLDREPLLADWTPASLAPHNEQVEVYSNCEEVELRLNGLSLGTLPRAADLAPRLWRVPFVKGTLEAIGRNGSSVVATHTLRTAGQGVGLHLQADRTQLPVDWEEVAAVEATLVDAAGTTVPNTRAVVRFSIEGPGAIVAVDNGDNLNPEPFVATQRTLYLGRCVAYVKALATGSPIRITATVEGRLSTTLEIIPAVQPPPIP